ncbi:MAG: CzcE family metal-binding protein [Burkholderiales bacterium]|nr:CzcE family metal-binding protein [Burkholderiales bacterium]
MISRKLLTAGIVSTFAFAAGSAFAAGDTLPNGKSRFGQPTADMQGTRVVDVANAKALNVRCGDTVTFVNGAKKFSWKFDTTNHGAVPLAKIAPADFGAVASTVYVSRNDSERGG